MNEVVINRVVEPKERSAAKEDMGNCRSEGVSIDQPSEVSCLRQRVLEGNETNGLLPRGKFSVPQSFRLELLMGIDSNGPASAKGQCHERSRLGMGMDLLQVGCRSNRIPAVKVVPTATLSLPYPAALSSNMIEGDMETRPSISCNKSYEHHRIDCWQQTVVPKSHDDLAPRHRHKNLPGEKWVPIVKRALEKPGVIEPFVRARFFAAGYFREVALTRGSERFEAGACEGASISSEQWRWRVTRLKELQALNRVQVIVMDAHPLAAWTRVVEDLTVLLEKVNAWKGELV